MSAATAGEEKKLLRREYRKKRAGLSPEEVSCLSRKICSNIEGLAAFQKADAVLCYMAYRNEVDLGLLMDRARDLGKQIFIPRVEGDRMDFYLYQRDDVLQVSGYGIEEPLPDNPGLWDLYPVGGRILMVMPGLAFDAGGNRLGYGGGFYDRYLAEYENKGMITLAAAYSLQLSDRPLPAEPRDIRPDYIVTEDNILEVKNERREESI